jgi:ABC-type hemin transport system ATPase subunit
MINNVKYADDLVLQAKGEMVLQDMVDKLIEVERCYGMEMNVGRRK